jgi:hypothetical protein
VDPRRLAPKEVGAHADAGLAAKAISTATRMFVE